MKEELGGAALIHRSAGEIETLNGHLKPIKSEARICRLPGKGFHGRQWLFEAVERWRRDNTLDARLFSIRGAPGIGKSAFAAQLTHTRGDTVIPRMGQATSQTS